MYFDIHDLKFAMYWMLGILGVVLLALAAYQQTLADMASDPLSNNLTVAILVLAGCGLLFFCLETFLLRNEEDIWR